MENTNLWQSKSFIKAMTGVAGLLAILLVVMIFSAVKEYSFIGGGVPVSNTISVSGEGEVFAVPDIATFSFSVVEERATAADAQTAATETINAVVQYLEDQGIEETEIKTTSYNLFPRYDFVRSVCNEFSCPPSERVLRGFEVTQSVTVEVKELDQAGTLLSGIGELGVQNISGLTFTIEDEEELISEAREKAIDDARKRAQELADQLNVDLVRVVSFSENAGGLPYYRSYADSAAFGIGGAVEEKAAPALPTGENKISSFVNIT